MTVPTGLGLTRGIETAMPAGTPLPNRAVLAAANNRKYGAMSQQPDPCYCGCCGMEKSCF